MSWMSFLNDGQKYATGGLTGCGQCQGDKTGGIFGITGGFKTENDQGQSTPNLPGRRVRCDLPLHNIDIVHFPSTFPFRLVAGDDGQSPWAWWKVEELKQELLEVVMMAEKSV